MALRKMGEPMLLHFFLSHGTFVQLAKHEKHALAINEPDLCEGPAPD